MLIFGMLRYVKVRRLLVWLRAAPRAESPLLVRLGGDGVWRSELGSVELAAPLRVWTAAPSVGRGAPPTGAVVELHGRAIPAPSGYQHSVLIVASLEGQHEIDAFRDGLERITGSLRREEGIAATICAIGLVALGIMVMVPVALVLYMAGPFPSPFRF